VTLYVGTSGFSYGEWRPGFYPEGLPQSRWLEHYGKRLSACEVNVTFYRVPGPETFAKWCAATPESFRFASKAHRRLTHAKNIVPRGELRAFWDDYLAALAGLGPRLGAILLQLPRHRERDDATLESLLEPLAGGTPFALELSNDSWNAPTVQARVAAAGGTVCLSDAGDGPVPEALPPGPLGYVRMRRERYDEPTREAWQTLLAREAETRDVYAFTKHKGTAPTDPAGGIGLSMWLESRR
jgi:uncharacterized protein YecE (DUF72 family)